MVKKKIAKGEASQGAHSQEDILVKLTQVIKYIRERGLVFKGHMCGVINGLRLAKILISGEFAIFERDEAQKSEPKMDIPIDSVLEEIAEKFKF